MSEEEKPKHNPQKYSWTNLKTFNSYPEAKDYKDNVKESPVKIKRTGSGGSQFTVKLGREIKK